MQRTNPSDEEAHKKWYIGLVSVWLQLRSWLSRFLFYTVTPQGSAFDDIIISNAPIFCEYNYKKTIAIEV